MSLLTQRNSAIVPDNTTRWNELSAALLAGSVTIVLMVLIFAGSRGLRDFDAALVEYAIGTVLAVAGGAYYQLTVALHRYLAGDGEDGWLLAIFSGLVFSGGLAALYVLRRLPTARS